MKVALDTNVLVRALMGDDKAQSSMAMSYIDQPDLIAIGTHVFCELAWVLKSGYGVARADIAAAIRKLLQAENVVVDRAAVEAGLAVLDVGGDFADGVIHYEGQWLGSETFVTFDKKAVALLTQLGKRRYCLLQMQSNSILDGRGSSMGHADTKVLTAHVPIMLVEKVDQLAARLDHSRSWIVQQALAAWIDQEEERNRLTREALADVDAGGVIDHQMVQAWVDSLSNDQPLPAPL